MTKLTEKENAWLTLFALVFFMFIFYGVVRLVEREEQARQELGCEYYKDVKARNIPGRCISYFNNK